MKKIVEINIDKIENSYEIFNEVAKIYLGEDFSKKVGEADSMDNISIYGDGSIGKYYFCMEGCGYSSDEYYTEEETIVYPDGVYEYYYGNGSNGGSKTYYPDGTVKNGERYEE